MCVILACDKKTGKPTKDMLKDAERMNDDGGSIAWIQGKKVRWEKGLKAKQIFKIVKKINLPFIIHFRIATHGGVNKPLCHPFPITENVELKLSGKADRVLFHNGIWSEYNTFALNSIINNNHKFPSGKMSDSRAMTWLVYHHGKEILNLIGDGNKMCILSSKNGIEYFGKNWCKVDDIKCSNDHFDMTTNYKDDYDNDMVIGANGELSNYNDDMLYSDEGELSEYDIMDCEYTREFDCYITPNNQYVYTLNQLDKIDKFNYSENNNEKQKMLDAQKEIEEMTPINHLSAKESRESYELDEWNNTKSSEWNKKYGL